LFVFNREKLLTSISDATGTCNVAPSSKNFNNFNGLISTTYDVSAIIESPHCLDLIGGDINTNSIAKYDPLDSIQMLYIDYDVRSLITAISINIGINSPEDLVLIPNTTISLKDGDNIYSLLIY
jgi:hypothetical protein